MRQLNQCPICAGARIRHVYSSPDLEVEAVPGLFHFWLCSTCSTYFQNPMPEAADIPAFYGSGKRTYFAHSQISSEAITANENHLGQRLSGFGYVVGKARGADNRLLDLKRVYGNSTPAKILDIGCGAGYLAVKVIQTLGAKPENFLGIDVDEGVEARGAALGLRFIRTTLEGLDASGFDLVLLSHVMEHVPNPRNLLIAIAERLVPGGRLAVSVPNAQSLFAKLMRQGWICHSIPRHLFNYSRQGVLTISRGVFDLELYSATQLYAFMLSLYYSRAVTRMLATPLRALQPITSLLSWGDNQSFIFRKAS